MSTRTFLLLALLVLWGLYSLTRALDAVQGLQL